MSSGVLDASAVLAFLDNEPGADMVRGILPSGLIGTVNLGEVYSVLAERGIDGVEALSLMCANVQEVVPFDEKMAQIVGALRPQTRHLGLSFGDRACLALGIYYDADVYTADRAWDSLQLPCRIRLIR